MSALPLPTGPVHRPDENGSPAPGANPGAGPGIATRAGSARAGARSARPALDVGVAAIGAGRPVYDALAWALQATLSLLGLFVFSPHLGLLAVLIKLSGGGPVLYRGTRVGRQMQPFTIYKFRTLAPDAEARIGARLLTPADKALLCTPIGRFLKRTKLDELPQLLNVITGDMRLVGPRPLRPIFLAQLRREIPNYHLRFLVPPGLTGIAQLRGGYYTSPRDKLRYDLVYVRNRSLRLDLWLVLLTFVKLLSRWLRTGLVVVFLFLFASFIPARLQPALRVSALGIDVSLVTVLVVVLAAWVGLRKGPSDFSLYRCPLNLPILLFVLLNVVSASLSEDPSRALRGSTYYVVTGFLTAFVIVNTLVSTVFVQWTVRTIALTSVVISSLGLFQIFLANHDLVPGGGGDGPPAPPSSILEDPVILVVYLILGIPLLLAELATADTPRAREFWLVCTTISFVGVFLTQTRIGLLALLVTVAIFLYRRRAQALAVTAVLVLCVLLVASVGATRLSPAVVGEAAARWVGDQGRVLSAFSPAQWLVGTGATVTGALLWPPPAGDTAATAPLARPANMHLTLLLEHGILGWLVTVWLVLATAAALAQAHARARDERVRTLLWAIVASLGGFLLSMAATNTFHHLPIQVFFWSLIGIGLGMATRVNGDRRANLIWRFGELGD